jgi:hypothetical protein
MERSNKRGKIPQQDWPSIITRYEAGETLASIARTYDCSPPAISYILTRTRIRDLPAESAEARMIEASEPQTLNTIATGMPVERATQTASESSKPAVTTSLVAVSDSIEPWTSETDPTGAAPDSNGAVSSFEPRSKILVTKTEPHPVDPNAREPKYPAVVPDTASGGKPQPDEPRRTLHLSISKNGDQSAEAPRRNGGGADPAGDSKPRPTRISELQNSGLPQEQPPFYRPDGGSSPSVMESEKGQVAATFVDRALRERVESDISVFLAAFDAALADDTAESRARLREATDRLLRAGARTRIELERLDARIPLSPRLPGGYSASLAWRQR